MTAAASAAIPALASARSAVAASAFTLPALPYATDALEPYIDAATMQLHHDKHYQANIDDLNKAVGGDSTLAKLSVEELLRRLDTLPAAIRTEVRNHGGGHANHSLFRKPFAPLPRARQAAWSTSGRR